ncbi:MAG: thermonuclease family protein [Bradymonadia bacterium]
MSFSRPKPFTRFSASQVLSAACCGALLCLAAFSTAHGRAQSKVFLNGVPHPVHFNDGDSFQVISGQFAGTKARLAGFNTLESFGPVHRWGKWTAKELYKNAKMATMNARRGVWHCESDLKTDFYGRILWWCEDLAVDQVRKGLAHAMSVTEEAAKPAVVAAQQEAIANRRGMWAHGVPEFVLTSIHSNDERPGDKKSYNRLVSSNDGHSRRWQHELLYSECEEVCWQPPDADERKRLMFDRLRRMTKGAEEVLKAYDDDRLIALVKKYKETGKLGLVGAGGLADAAHRETLEPIVKDWVEHDWLRNLDTEISSCMTYVDFRRRFGSNQASCLRK